MILGAGAYRHPSGEFHRMVKRAKKEIKDKYLGKVVLPISRNEIGSRIDAETLANWMLCGNQNKQKAPLGGVMT